MTAQEHLFGTKLCPVNKAEMARIIGVDPSTMCRWAKNPGIIPLNMVQKIVRLRNLPDAVVVQIMKERL